MQVPGHPVAMQPNMESVNNSLAYYSQQHVHQVPGMVCIASQPAHPCLNIEPGLPQQIPSYHGYCTL